jgi:excisionase family DNA binding protein
MEGNAHHSGFALPSIPGRLFCCVAKWRETGVTQPEIGAILTVMEAARLAGVSEGAIRFAADKGQIPCLKTANGLRIFKLEAVEDYVRARAAKRAPAA